MMKNPSYLPAINVEEFLFERYQQIYDMAKAKCETEVMVIASDRQAALLGVSFAMTDDYDDNE